MALKDINKTLINIKDADHFKDIVDLSEKRLVDVYREWCGVCEAMHPTFQSILTELDDSDEKICLASANSDKLLKFIQDTFPKDIQASLNLETSGCTPIFALYKKKTCISVIVGVDAPSLIFQISKNINYLDE